MKIGNNHQEPQRILGIFAHPDDEVFCAGGLLAQAAARGAETMVVSATRGEAGQIHDTQAATRYTLGQVREQELHRAGRHLGVDETVCLNYSDGTLAFLEPIILVQELTYLIRRFRPDTVITFGPDGAYGHPDHIAIGAAATEAVRLAGDGHQFPEQLVGGLRPHRPKQLYYSHFPHKQRLLSERLAHWLVALHRRFQGTVDFAQALLLFSNSAMMLGYISDSVDIQWFPAGFHIVEQNEPAHQLYLILSGEARVRYQSENGRWHDLAHIGPGHFFGEEGIAHHQPRNAHVVADGDVTCLVFSPEAPLNYAGRGSEAQLTNKRMTFGDAAQSFPDNVISIDVTQYVSQKVAALAAHRTQFPMNPDMIPMSILGDLFGQEHFIQAPPSGDIEQSQVSQFPIEGLMPV